MLSSRCEPLKEFRPRDRTRAKRFEMRRKDLDIHPIQSALCQMIDEVQECKVRSIGFEMKHAFAGERAARINTIDSSHKAAVMPGFGAMSMAQTMKLNVRPL